MRPRPRETKLLTKRHQILNRVFRERQCSRFALARSLNINPSMVGVYVDAFLRDGLLVEDYNGLTRRGRSPVPVRPNPDHGRFLGIDFEALRARAVLTDFAGEVLEQKEVPFRSSITRPEVLEAVVALAKSLAGRTEGRPLLSLGVAAPGQVDPGRGRVLRYELLPDFAEVPILETFRRHFAVPVFVEDNIRCLTYAELLRGAGRGHRHFLCLVVRSGMGVGIVIDGRLYAGAGEMAGEVGYAVFPQPDGPRRLTELVSAKGIVRQVVQMLRSLRLTGRRRALRAKGEDLALAEIVATAEAGDVALREHLEGVGRNLGLVLANLANLFAPEKIVLAGEVPRCSPLVGLAMEQTFRQHTLATIRQDLVLADSRLSGFAAALGAAYLGFARTFPEDETGLAREATSPERDGPQGKRQKPVSWSA